MKNLICFSLFLIGCASCNDTIKDAPGVEVTFKNPVLLYFENEEELQNTLEGISELSEEELINWEESKNFFSYRRLISNVFEEMLQEQNPEKLEKLIIENKVKEL